MSVIQVFKPENRLAKIVTDLGGKHVTAAVEDANQQLSQISDECLKHVDEALAQIYQYTSQTPGEDASPSLYRSIRDVAGLAAICDLPDLGAAALSICNLLDNAQNGGPLSDEELRVSRNVLRILRRPEMVDEQGRRSILANFEILVEKSAPKDAARLGEQVS